MAVESASITAASGKKERSDTPQKDKGNVAPSPAKRRTNPGIRVVGGRIYDSANGRTCHQCRQKTRDFTAACKNQRNNKPCPIMFCHKCLLNRYGEKAEEVVTVGEWSCPKCRGICNCSFCMKKRGCAPTGLLIHTAKATGYKSVSEMLLNGGNQVPCAKVPEMTTPKKEVLSPNKRGKENCFDGKVDANLPNPGLDKKTKNGEKNAGRKRKAKDEGLQTVSEDNSDVHVANETTPAFEAKLKKVKLNGSKSSKKAVAENNSDVHVSNETAPAVDAKPKKVKLNGSKSSKKAVAENNSDVRVSNETAPAVEAKPKKVKLNGSTSNKKAVAENNLDVHMSNEATPVVEAKQKKVKLNGSKSSKKAVTENNSDVHVSNETAPAIEAKQKKMKLNGSKSTEKNKENDKEVSKETSLPVAKKRKASKSSGLEKDSFKKENGDLARRTSPRKQANLSKTSNQEAELNTDEQMNSSFNIIKKGPIFDNDKKNVDSKIPTETVLKQQVADIFANIPLPVGKELTNVAGIDVSAEDAGSILQFIQFCAVFGKILDIKKGQAEYVLRDLLQGRAGRRGKFSVTVQFHIDMLSAIQEDEGEESGRLTASYGKNSWFNALKEYVSESHTILKAQVLKSTDAVDYDTLDVSEKLKLLNFLCDEVLETEKVKSWIDDQNTKHAESVKEAKQKLVAARNEEKGLKQKMKDDIAEAILAKQGVGLSISEHEAIVSHIKSDTQKAHAKMLESKGLYLDQKKIPDAVRIEPIFTGGKYSYWKLNGESNVLCQNVGKGDNLALNDKWSTLDDEEKASIEKRISFLREKK